MQLSKTLVTSYESSSIRHFGAVKLLLRRREKLEQVPFFVVEKENQVLLGHGLRERFGLMPPVHQLASSDATEHDFVN